MSSAKKPTITIASPVHLDDRTALHMIQAFNQETEIPGLLALLFSQLHALCDIQGLNYSNEALELECQLGENNDHEAEYDLEYGEQHLGVLKIYSPAPQQDTIRQKGEDLVALSFTALRNAVALSLAELNSPPDLIPSREVQELSDEEKADALILLAVDGYHAMVSKSGEEWAQVLMTSVHTHIKDGLRQADGVYQISNELIAILLPHTTEEQAHQVAEKVRVLVDGLHLSGTDSDNLTVCMGIADAKLARTAEDVMANAKLALAAARDSGTSCIRVFDPSLSPEQL